MVLAVLLLTGLLRHQMSKYSSRFPIERETAFEELPDSIATSDLTLGYYSLPTYSQHRQTERKQ
jgi:hypothetical protein